MNSKEHNVFKRKRCLGAKCSSEEMLRGAKGSREQSVLRSKVFLAAKGVKGQRGLGSKVFQDAKHSMRHSLLRSNL